MSTLQDIQKEEIAAVLHDYETNIRDNPNFGPVIRQETLNALFKLIEPGPDKYFLFNYTYYVPVYNHAEMLLKRAGQIEVKAPNLPAAYKDFVHKARMSTLKQVSNISITNIFIE